MVEVNLADGRLHMSGIKLLIPHLSESNRDALLKRATHQSKRKIEELVAEIAPKPDVAASIRKLPERNGKAQAVAKLGLELPELVPERVGCGASRRPLRCGPRARRPAAHRTSRATR